MMAEQDPLWPDSQAGIKKLTFIPISTQLCSYNYVNNKQTNKYTDINKYTYDIHIATLPSLSTIT